MRAAEAGGSQSGSEDEEERRGVTGGRDRLAARLQQDAAEAAGRLHRNLAHRVTVPDQGTPAEASSSEDEASDDDDDEAVAAAAAARIAAYGAGRFRPGHELSATALALSLDGSTAFTVSKDGSILKWDVETGRKLQLMRCGSARPRRAVLPRRPLPGAAPQPQPPTRRRLSSFQAG